MVTSRVTCVKHATRVDRHARARAYHHRFARVITVFRPPRARPARARCSGGGARSLARARAVWRWRWRWRSVTSRVTRARHARHARACTSSPRIARVITAPLPRCHPCARGSGGGAVSFARTLARAEAEAVGLGEAVGYIARHARQTRHARRSSRARTRVSSPLRARHHRFPSPPCTTGTRALLRRRCSLARSRARAVWRWRWRWRSVTPRITRVTRVTRARVHVITAHRARHHRPPSPMSPMRAHGSGGGAVSFARLLARAEAEADGHSHVVRVSRVTRARERVIIATALVSATPIEVRSFRRRLVFSSLFSLVFSFFVSPRAHYDEHANTTRRCTKK